MPVQDIFGADPFDEILGGLRADDDASYYVLTITGSADDTISWDTHTMWSGWADLNRKVENRVPSLVLGRFRQYWELIGQPYYVLDQLELHVHHIRPWAEGGLTEIANLITLCGTCHRGLEPHEDTTLFEYIGRPSTSEENAGFREFLVGVREYHRMMAKCVLPE